MPNSSPGRRRWIWWEKCIGPRRISPEGGFRIEQPAPAGRRVDSVEYRRRPGAADDPRLPPLPVDRQWLLAGSRDADHNRRAIELPRIENEVGSDGFGR